MWKTTEETAVYPTKANDEGWKSLFAPGYLLPMVAAGKVCGEMRITGWTTMSAEALWKAWSAQFASQEEAVATAVWVTNKLIKGSSSRDASRKFYSIKEHWLSMQESVGRKVRLEEKFCFRCDGNGCERCDYSGVWEEKWLYEHEFFIHAQRYNFHGYSPPRILLEDMGKNAEVFGSKFSDEEVKALSLPMSGMVKMLGYVAAALLGLVFNGRRYVKREGMPLDERPVGLPTYRVVNRRQFTTDDIRHWWVR